jgi:hypothetical protein
MGTWAFAPWDNDGAADWFGDLMDRTELRKEWLKGIREDPSESPEVVRAAGALFVMLGRVYVWPIGKFDEDLEEAISALSKVAACDDYQDTPELAELIAMEIDELKSRRKPTGGSSAPSAPNRDRPWWRFW